MRCNICTKKLEGGDDIYVCVKIHGVTSVILSLQPQQRSMVGFFVLKIHDSRFRRISIWHFSVPQLMF